MYIKTITIYGFGKWVDTSFEITQSFTCIYGENESGKSTLQKFILFMLFGLPPKARTFYRPKTSGKMGGRLTIYDFDVGEYTIERLDERDNGKATCYLPNGETRDEDWLHKQLKGLTYDTYESIFSFSALDLVGLDQMNDEDIGEVILGIGLTGSQHIQRLEKQMDQKLGNLFKPNGRIPVINKQFQRLDELLDSLTKYKRVEATYREKQLDLETTKQEIKRLQSKRHDLISEQSLLNKQKHALSSMNDYHDYVNEIKQLPAHIPFPENGVERLKQIKDKLLPLQSEWNILKENKQKNEQKYNDIKKQLFDENIVQQAQSIIQKRSIYNEQQREYQEIQQTIQHEQQDVEKQLSDLHIELHLEQLGNIHFPFHIEKLWQTLNNDQQQLKLEAEQLEQEYITLNRQKDMIKSQIKDIKQRILPPHTINELYEKIDAYYVNDSYQHLQKKKNEQQKAWGNKYHAKTKQLTYVLSFSVVMGIVLGMSAFFFKIPMLYHAMILLIVIGCSQWYFGKQSIQQIADDLAVQDRYAEPVAYISIDEKSEVEDILQKDDEYNNRLHTLTDQLRSLDIQMIQWEEKKISLDQRTKRLEKQISLEQDKYPFLNDINVSYWSELYHTLRQFQTTLENIDKQKQRVQKLYEEQKDFEQTIRQFLEKIKLDTNNMSINKMLDVIEKFIEDQKQLQSLRRYYEKENIETDRQQREVKTKIHTYEAEIEYLFNVAKVKTEEEFYKQAAVVEKQQISTKAIKEIEQHLSTIFPNEEWKNINIKTLDEHSLHVRIEHIDEDLQHIEQALDKNRQTLANITADISNMESSDEYSQTLHQYIIEKEELQVLAKEWAVIKTAQDMLAATKRSYREKYLSKVIDKTTRYFSHITDKRYTNVFAPRDRGILQVEAADSIRYNVNELSQGTVDQLYIALRLAISDMMSMNHKVPFMIDDAFIHSDHIRTRRMIDLLVEISRQHQMILFTCNHDIIQSLAENEVIRLERRIRIN